MTRPIHVLHVDDDAALRDLTAEFLERVSASLTVHSVADPDGVAAVLDAEPIDCVVSDYEMPGTNGLELCREVRESRPELPFFLFTSRGGEELIRAAMDAGATDYVRKEPGIEQYTLLANRIDNAVSRSRLEARLAELDGDVEERSASGDAASSDAAGGDAAAGDAAAGDDPATADHDLDVESVAESETESEAVGSVEH